MARPSTPIIVHVDPSERLRALFIRMKALDADSVVRVNLAVLFEFDPDDKAAISRGYADLLELATKCTTAARELKRKGGIRVHQDSVDAIDSVRIAFLGVHFESPWKDLLSRVNAGVLPAFQWLIDHSEPTPVDHDEELNRWKNDALEGLRSLEAVLGEVDAERRNEAWYAVNEAIGKAIVALLRMVARGPDSLPEVIVQARVISDQSPVDHEWGRSAKQAADALVATVAIAANASTIVSVFGGRGFVAAGLLGVGASLASWTMQRSQTKDTPRQITSGSAPVVSVDIGDDHEQ